MRIELAGVGKRYGRLQALRDVNLDLPSGARVALIGPNGSGKTTLTRAIMGVIAHEGSVRLDGRDAFAERATLAHRLAYVPQVAPQMASSVGEMVRAIASVRGATLADFAASAAQLDIDLGALRKRPFRGLSGGMKQKLLLALAFASRASLLVLDEPTASLDAVARARFFELYERCAGTATLVLCSHRLEEIRHLVDRVVLLTEGRVAYAGPAEAFLEQRSMAEIALHVTGDGAWVREHGFRAGAGGWWARTVPTAEKTPLLRAALGALGPELLNVVVRDLDALTLTDGASDVS